MSFWGASILFKLNYYTQVVVLLKYTLHRYLFKARTASFDTQSLISDEDAQLLNSILFASFFTCSISVLWIGVIMVKQIWTQEGTVKLIQLAGQVLINILNFKIVLFFAERLLNAIFTLRRLQETISRIT